MKRQIIPFGEFSVREGFSYSFDEYRQEVLDFLKSYNLAPAHFGRVAEFYEDEMREWHESGRYTRNLADKIARELGLGSGGVGGFLPPAPHRKLRQ